MVYTPLSNNEWTHYYTLTLQEVRVGGTAVDTPTVSVGYSLKSGGAQGGKGLDYLQTCMYMVLG